MDEKTDETVCVYSIHLKLATLSIMSCCLVVGSLQAGLQGSLVSSLLLLLLPCIS